MNRNLVIIGILAIVFFAIAFKGCDSGPSSQSEKYSKSPVDELVRDLTNEPNFTIILYDMDADEDGKNFKHKYNILIDKNDDVNSKITDWMPVSKSFFEKNMDNMGMEIASKKDGKITKAVAPAGYTNYVGNEKYGQWVERDGGSFWEFYGKYAMISSIVNLATFPIRQSYWNDYNHNYYGNNRGYYGPMNNGAPMYGTNSNYNQSNKNSSWNNKPNDFKQRVQSKVNRSSSAAPGRSKSVKSTENQRSRSSSRYSGSSTRSRGGGFGK